MNPGGFEVRGREADTSLDIIRDLLIGESEEILERAKEEGDLRLAIAALRTIARLAGFI